MTFSLSGREMGSTFIIEIEGVDTQYVSKNCSVKPFFFR